jgi:uncharacterized cupin superfamily protein
MPGHSITVLCNRNGHPKVQLNTHGLRFFHIHKSLPAGGDIIEPEGRVMSTMKPFSVLDVPWTEFTETPRFACRYRHLSRAALGGNYRVGVAIEELEPGKQSAPAHYHMLEEEHVYVLEGTLTARIGAGSYEMTAGGYACFPAGQKAGHCLVNNSGTTCRYVIIGERNPDDVVVYPDSGKVLVRALGRILDMEATRGYWDGEDTGLPDGVSPPAAAPRAPEVPAEPKPPISSHDVAWDETSHAPGFVDRNKHLTMAAADDNYHVGVLIEAPPPGMRTTPRHYHMLEEEHALILEGEITLLLGDERYKMMAGDYVCFPAGRQTGHSFLNSGPGPCSYLMIGEHSLNDVCVLPDSNKMQVRALGRRGAFFDMSRTSAYLDGEQAG